MKCNAVTRDTNDQRHHCTQDISRAGLCFYHFKMFLGNIEPYDPRFIVENKEGGRLIYIRKGVKV